MGEMLLVHSLSMFIHLFTSFYTSQGGPGFLPWTLQGTEAHTIQQILICSALQMAQWARHNLQGSRDSNMRVLSNLQWTMENGLKKREWKRLYLLWPVPHDSRSLNPIVPNSTALFGMKNSTKFWSKEHGRSFPEASKPHHLWSWKNTKS